MKIYFILYGYYSFLNCQKSKFHKEITKNSQFTMWSKPQYHVALDHIVIYAVHSQVLDIIRASDDLYMCHQASMFFIIGCSRHVY